jgi:hypothetical protein
MTEESEITQVVLAASPGESKLETQNRSPLFKIARVLVRLIKLPASSQTRITASCDRLKNLA